MIKKLISSLAIAAASFSSLAQTAEAPTFDVGDKWTFSYENQDTRAYTYTNQAVKSADGSAWLYSTTSNPKDPHAQSLQRYDYARAISVESFDLNPAGGATPGDKFADFSAEESRLQFPLFVGKKYSYQKMGDISNFQYDVEVKAMEKVTTPAGEFDAFRIEFDGHWHMIKGINNLQGPARCTSFYAPAVKQEIKRECTSLTVRHVVTNQSLMQLAKFEAKAELPPGFAKHN